MITRNTLTFAVTFTFILLARSAVRCERWSRQVSNSEWIPLAHPKTAPSHQVQGHIQGKAIENEGVNGLLTSPDQQVPIPPISLSPALQQQYQNQLLQLQKTQESIQKLLLLQQQLKTQQRVLQSQAFPPSSFNSPENGKQPSRQSALPNTQTFPEIAAQVLVPPLPSTEALPPIYGAQNFHAQNPEALKQDYPVTKDAANVPDELDYVEGHDESIATVEGHNVEGHQPDSRLKYNLKQQGVPYLMSKPRKQQQPNHQKSFASSTPYVAPDAGEDEEIQLVYVPAETLAQRGQSKSQQSRIRKPNQYHRQQYHTKNHHEVPSTTISPSNQDAFARALLHQLQREHEEKSQFYQSERLKEISRLNDEQREIERQAKLHQEAIRKEQELKRQREEEKQKKELEKLEEHARQRELQRLRQGREKQKLAEIERKRLSDFHAKEEKRRKQEEEAKREEARLRELERLATLEREEKVKEQQREIEAQNQKVQQERQQSVWSDVQQGQTELSPDHEQPQALPLVRDQHKPTSDHRLPEPVNTVKSNRLRNRPRPKIHHHYHHQSSNRDREVITTTPSPNQPPLAVYMDNLGSETRSARVSDVLKLLKNAKTISVLDSIGPGTPKVFVGPSNLDPPPRYVKFELPYLSSIENNRVERKVEKLPFFVAPLSFDPPTGYSKIPFPAPHIGSVVVNTEADLEHEANHQIREPNPVSTIKSNSYSSSTQQTTPEPYDVGTTIPYSHEPSTTAKYEHVPVAKNHANTRFRFRQSYNEGKPSTKTYEEKKIPSVVTAASYQDERTSSAKIERPTKSRLHYSSHLPSTTPSYHSSRVVSAVSYQGSVSDSTPKYHERTVTSQQEPRKHEKLDVQLAQINKEIAQHKQAIKSYQIPEQQQRHQYVAVPSSQSTVNPYYSDSSKYADPTSVIGSTQYSLPAELPAISPHLPGLVNALVEKNESPTPITTTPTTTTTTTTTETPTTTHRGRGRHRGRVVTTRATTTRPVSRSNSERSRRPYNRSRTRVTTTTEAYKETYYEPTKSKNEETTQRYEPGLRRRPVSRTQKHRGQTTDSRTTQSTGNNRNVQNQVLNSYEPVPTVETTTTTINITPTPSVSTLNLLANHRENYPPSTVSSIDNYPPNDATSASVLPREPIRKTKYQQHIHPQEEVQYSTDYETPNQMKVDEQPVNGFNYQIRTGNPTSDTPQTLRDYSFYQSEKTDGVQYEQPEMTEVPRLKKPQPQDYVPVYNQDQVNYDAPVDEFVRTENAQPNYYQTELKDDENVEPVFVPIPQQDKPDDYVYRTSEIPQEIVTRRTTVSSSTTESPLIIRQKVRTRLGPRVQQDSVVQTRPRGSQDEYVRFSTINHDSDRTSSSVGRQREHSLRPRPSIRPQTNYNSPVQTEGQEYVRIQTAQHYRNPVTTTTTSAPEEEEEEVDYGFIRTPSFPPVQSEEKFQTAVPYRPNLQNQVSTQYIESGDVTAIDSSPTQAEILKNRQKYNTPNRRPAVKIATTPASKFSYATTLPDDSIYMTRSSLRNDDTRTSKNRNRVRRPGGRRRTTTTTPEPGLEANNELPLDENYPRIIQTIQRPLLNPRPVLYEDNYEQEPISTLRNSSAQYNDRSEDNYPPQDYIVNYGILPTHDDRVDEYDQGPLPSNVPQKYNQDSHTTTYPAHLSASDIYGAESQWSTKLSRGSFQPSNSPNEAIEFSKKFDKKKDEKKLEEVPEIITAGPEVSSVTVLVSSKYGQNSEGIEPTSEDVMMKMTDFGKKMNSEEQTKETDAVTNPKPTSVIQKKIGHEFDSSVEQSTIKSQTSTKKSTDPVVVKRNGRRRRVRVRVRPLEDFVTSETQHYDSAFNNLVNSPSKGNRIRDFYTTTQPSTSSTPQATTAGSIPDDFTQKILGNNEQPSVSDIEIDTKTTTVVPDVSWTLTTTMTPELEDTETTLNDITTTTEDYSLSKILTGSEVETDKPYGHSSTTIIDRTKSEESKTTFFEEHYTSSEDDQDSKMIKNETQVTRESSSKMIQSNDVKPGEKQMENSTESLEEEEPVKKPEFNVLGNNYSNKEIFSRFANDALESLNFKDDDDQAPDDHPKNHRTKWSEVRYPSDRSILDYAKYYSTNYENRTSDLKKMTEQVPSVMTFADETADTKTLSDYVKDIFESIKSAENSDSDLTAAEDRKDHGDSETVEITEPTVVTIAGNTSSDVTETDTKATTDPIPAEQNSGTTTTESTNTANLSKVLRTSTTTKVSHMTEICYRGKCVMTRPKREGSFR